MSEVLGMEKIFKVLHKKYDQKFDKIETIKTKRAAMEALFKQCKLAYKQCDDLAFFHNEIIYQGILNKQAIENAYFEGRVLMDDFYDTLDYAEKQRMMNYEIEKVKPSLPFVVYKGEAMYIPFLDLRMNAIYRKEMVLFDIKKYNYYVRRFEQIMIDAHEAYGNIVYNAAFCSAYMVYEYEQQIGLYCEANQCLYFIEHHTLVNHLTCIHEVSIEIMKNICYSFFHSSFDEFIALLEGLSLIKEKELKKIHKYRKRMK